MYIDVPSEEALPALPRTEELHRHKLEFICKQYVNSLNLL